MSPSAASFSICFPKASSASATLASSLIAGAPLSCRFPGNYSAQYHRHTPNQKRPSFSQRARLGSVPNAVAPWFSSRDFLPPSCSSVRHLLSPEPPHETTIPTFLLVASRQLEASCALLLLRPVLRFQPRLKVLLPPRTNFHPTYLAFDLSSASTCSGSLPRNPMPIEFP
jgi:hypothetical protein